MREYDGIILLGRPGAGKSTIGKEIAKMTGMVYISSGDIARAMAETDKVTAENLRVGMMATEDTMRSTILQKLNDAVNNTKAFILDGFPRTIDQYEWLQKNFKFRSYIVNVPAEECLNRLYERGRTDDVLETILNRNKFFTLETIRVIQWIKINKHSYTEIINTGRPVLNTVAVMIADMGCNRCL